MTSREVQFKEFSLTKEEIRPRMDYEWIGKTISKNQMKKTENQFQNAACENHQPAMKIWFIQKTRTRMKYEWIGKTIQKKIQSKK